MNSIVSSSHFFDMQYRSAWSLPGQRGRHTSTVINIKITLDRSIVASKWRRSRTVWLLLNLSLNGELGLPGGKNAAFFLINSPSLAVADMQGKRHAARAHKPASCF